MPREKFQFQWVLDQVLAYQILANNTPMFIYLFQMLIVTYKYDIVHRF